VTVAQYKRLLLVLTVPLLLVGAIFTKVAIRPDHYASIICQNDVIFGENCRITDGLGEKWDNQLRTQSPAWFDVEFTSYEKNIFPHTFVSGSQRYVSNIIIRSVDTYLGTYDGPNSYVEELRGMVGQEISIIFGNNPDDERLLNPLGCNELKISERGDNHSADLCGVPGGVVRVHFTAVGESKYVIDNLKEKIVTQVSMERYSIILVWIFGTIFPVLLFLLASIVVFIVKRACIFIKSG